MAANVRVLKRSEHACPFERVYERTTSVQAIHRQLVSLRPTLSCWPSLSTVSSMSNGTGK